MSDIWGCATLLSGCSGHGGFLSVLFPLCPNSCARVPTENIRGWKGNGGRRRRGLDPVISQHEPHCRQAAHLGVGVEQGNSQSPVLWCTLELSFMRQCKCVCVTLIKLINFAEASGNGDRNNCSRI